MPPSPACETMSASFHSSAAAAARSAALSSCRSPWNAVSLVDGRTGWQSAGSAQSHTMPRAQPGISIWVMTTVGTCGIGPSAPPARARSALTA
eukprot:638038-Pleurochrysis_carterae.AAC.1